MATKARFEYEKLKYDEGMQGESAGWALFDSNTGQPLTHGGWPVVGTRQAMESRADELRQLSAPATPVLTYGRASGSDLAAQLHELSKLMAEEPSGVYRHAAQAVSLAASALLGDWTTLNAIQQAGAGHLEYVEGKARPMQFVFRESSTGRGVRLHQVTSAEAEKMAARGVVASANARDAVLASAASIPKGGSAAKGAKQ